jgi:hypothetical protein
MAEQEETRKPQIWRINKDASAHIDVHEDHININGNEKNFIIVGMNGITVRGNFSVASMGEGRKTGALFTPMNEIPNMIPKTIMTPIPLHLPIPPLGMIMQLLGAVQIGMALIPK